MNILVLGDSDSAGVHTGGQSWVQLLEADLRESGLPEVSVRSLAFSAVPSSAAAYAERRVEEQRPQAVIVMVGAWGFTYTMVRLQVEARFGKRAARWYTSLEQRFESRSRPDGGKPPRLNRLARKAVRRIIGARAQINREQLTEHYREVLRRLARFEDIGVIVMTYQGIGDHIEAGDMPAQRGKFFADIQRAAESHRYGWVHEPDLFADFSDWHAYAIDELHFNMLGHGRIKETVAPLVRELAGVKA